MDKPVLIRMFSEGLLIVVSILLALSADAWLDSRKQEIQLDSHVAALGREEAEQVLVPLGQQHEQRTFVPSRKGYDHLGRVPELVAETVEQRADPHTIDGPCKSHRERHRLRTSSAYSATLRRGWQICAIFSKRPLSPGLDTQIVCC